MGLRSYIFRWLRKKARHNLKTQCRAYDGKSERKQGKFPSHLSLTLHSNAIRVKGFSRRALSCMSPEDA